MYLLTRESFTYDPEGSYHDNKWETYKVQVFNSIEACNVAIEKSKQEWNRSEAQYVTTDPTDRNYIYFCHLRDGVYKMAPADDDTILLEYHKDIKKHIDYRICIREITEGEEILFPDDSSIPTLRKIEPEYDSELSKGDLYFPIGQQCGALEIMWERCLYLKETEVEDEFGYAPKSITSDTNQVLANGETFFSLAVKLEMNIEFVLEIITQEDFKIPEDYRAILLHSTYEQKTVNLLINLLEINRPMTYEEALEEANDLF